MARTSKWTGLVTRHFLAKAIIISLAISSAVVWVNRPISAHALKEKSGNGASILPSASEPIPPVPATSVRVVVNVMPSRLIVVDDHSAITQIWSNTYNAQPGSYSLKVRRNSQFGQEQALTDEIQRDYAKLAGAVDWGKTGLVYDARKRS